MAALEKNRRDLEKHVWEEPGKKGGESQLIKLFSASVLTCVCVCASPLCVDQHSYFTQRHMWECVPA